MSMRSGINIEESDWSSKNVVKSSVAFPGSNEEDMQQWRLSNQFMTLKISESAFWG